MRISPSVITGNLKQIYDNGLGKLESLQLYSQSWAALWLNSNCLLGPNWSTANPAVHSLNQQIKQAVSNSIFALHSACRVWCFISSVRYWNFKTRSSVLSSSTWRAIVSYQRLLKKLGSWSGVVICTTSTLFFCIVFRTGSECGTETLMVCYDTFVIPFSSYYH